MRCRAKCGGNGERGNDALVLARAAGSERGRHVSHYADIALMISPRRDGPAHAWLATALPSAAWAAAKRAIGTRNGEQET
jgi:hypothetical protein